jgi:hypothetical protein
MLISKVGWDSLVDIATRWTAQGLNPGGGEIFRTRRDWPWGPFTFL